ncbi:gamma carbonic anhydrase family protein [Candidatus Woesearchaeota archaeon]|nr:gamma carbonic anhydrase family protein [Candidatus Woesearchaeota archaeon]
MKNKKPDIHNNCFIDKSAIVIGDVTIDNNSSVWMNCVIRGDMNKVRIGKNTNIQDNSTIHNGPGNPVFIGNNITVGHNCVLHGCRIKDNCLIGMGAIILNGAVIGNNSIVGAGAVITENKKFPANSLILGVPGKVVRKINKKDIERINKNCKEYLELASQYKSKE